MSKYFTIDELTRSATATERRIDNTPPPDVKVRLATLINNVLDPVREKWGRPIRVNSGFRSPVLNKAVGGVPSSQHVKGEAADITTGSAKDNRKLFNLVVKLKESGAIQFDQLIDEKGYSWIHVSYKGTGNRNQILHL